MPGSKIGRVYVGRLSSSAREKDLERFFRGFGPMRDCIVKNGYGFVEFEDYRDADDAVYEMHGKELLGKRVTVEHAKGISRRPPQREQRRPVWLDRYGPPTRTPYRVIVENLSSKISWQDLKDYMRKAGEISYADAHRHRSNEGIVDFSSYSDMKRAIDKLDGEELMGRRIRMISQYRSRDRDRRSRSRSRHRRSYTSSRSRSRSRSRSKDRSRSRSRSRRRSRSKSRSRSDSRDRSRSRSKRRTSSRSPKKGSSRSPRRDSRSRSKERSRSPKDKSRSRDRDSSPGSDRDKGRRKSKSHSRSRSRSKRDSRDRYSSRSRSRSGSPEHKRAHWDRSRSVSRSPKEENGYN